MYRPSRTDHKYDKPNIYEEELKRTRYQTKKYKEYIEANFSSLIVNGSTNKKRKNTHDAQNQSINQHQSSSQSSQSSQSSSSSSSPQQQQPASSPEPEESTLKWPRFKPRSYGYRTETEQWFLEASNLDGVEDFDIFSNLPEELVKDFFNQIATGRSNINSKKSVEFSSQFMKWYGEDKSQPQPESTD